MTVQSCCVATGHVLFRFRSFLPLAMFVGMICLFWNYIPVNMGWSVYLWRTVAIGITSAGVVLRCATIGRVPHGTSGRNTKQQKASTLNTTGTYSVVRNPLYVGNAMVWIGVTLLLETPAFTAAFGVGLFIYYVLVVCAETEYLARQFPEQYSAYVSRTPALIPQLGKWIPSDRPFSWRMVVRREHDSVFSAVTGIVLVLHCMAFRANSERFVLRYEWAIPWLVIACLWIALKVLKKKTNLLHVPREYVSATETRPERPKTKAQ